MSTNGSSSTPDFWFDFLGITNITTVRVITWISTNPAFHNPNCFLRKVLTVQRASLFCWAPQSFHTCDFGKLLFSSSVVSNALWPHAPQHTRLPCPSLSPRACSNSCLLSLWCHPTISSSVVPFSSCLESFPASGSFPMSGLFTSGGQNIGASASVLQTNIKDWFPLALTGLISLKSKESSRVFSSTKFKSIHSSHIHSWLLEKP